MQASVRELKLIGFCCVTAVVSSILATPLLRGETPFEDKKSPGKAQATATEPDANKGEVHDSVFLVREVVWNELHDHATHGYWRYWIEKHSSKDTQLHDAVETPEGPVARLELTDGRPLTPENRETENRRLEHLLNSPSEQAQHRKDYADDEKRIGRILALLPEAFLYEPAQFEPHSEQMPACPCMHMRFRPNPDYPPHSIEARIFHAMAGDLWVSTKWKRMVRLDGKLIDNVDFGYGILGRLYKDGWFRLERTQVSTGNGTGDWKTQRLEIHMNGRAMFFKTVGKETSELRYGFTPVSPGLSLQQAATLVGRPETTPAVRPAALAAIH